MCGYKAINDIPESLRNGFASSSVIAGTIGLPALGSPGVGSNPYGCALSRQEQVWAQRLPVRHVAVLTRIHRDIATRVIRQLICDVGLPPDVRHSA